MKLKLISSLILGAVIALPGCTPSAEYNPAVNAPLTAAQAQTDAKILGAVSTLNQNEIALAALAQNKATNTAVRRYADWMYKEHSHNLQETMNLSRKLGVTPQNGPVAVKLQKQGKRQLAVLNHTNGVVFDKKYIAAMVRDHSEAIVLLNGLMKVTTNPVLLRELEITRSHVMSHLQKAQAVQQEMGLA